MTTKEIAERLTAFCREGKFEEAQKELFSEDVVSIERQPRRPLRRKQRDWPHHKKGPQI